MKSGKDIHVCVLGAGVCGLVSVKACLESGFKVTCFDRSDNYGGLWRYRSSSSQEDEFVPSVMRTTILNTSKELSAFSDFPPPGHLPNFMKHNLYMDYIDSYVQHFKLLPHLKLKHEVLQCEPEFNTSSGQIEWLVKIRDIRQDKILELKFDRIMIAIGHHNIPFAPHLPGQQKFRGQVLHSARIKDILSDQRFIDKRVAIVGLGNSACDAANDLAVVTEKCYVSCHRGNWFLSRLTPNGLYDFQDKNRWNNYIRKLLGKSAVDRIIINKLEGRTNHKLLGLTPQHKPSELVPTINDLLPYRIFTGGVILKGSLLRLTEDGAIFEGEEETEYKLDVVVLATGYQAKVASLNEYELGIKSAELDEYELYLNIFAPKLNIQRALLKVDGNEREAIVRRAIKSLAFIGLVQPSGSITVISELQARLATLVFEGKCELPSSADMMKHVVRVRRRRANAVRSHSKDQLVGNWMGYADLVAKQFGVRPNLKQLFFKDFALWRKLMFGPSVSYQYRLKGPNSWNKARETIMTVEDRVYEGINEGKNHILFKTRRRSLSRNIEIGGNKCCKNGFEQKIEGQI